MTTNKPEVKRYDCTSGGAQHCYGCYTMKECELGDYVEWEAYEALQAECEALKKQIEELREAQLSDRERECLHIGRAVERAAAELPVGYELRIELERDAGSVRLFDDMSEEIEIDADGPFSDQINSAIEAAMETTK